jgi:hypothetical protein
MLTSQEFKEEFGRAKKDFLEDIVNKNESWE